MRLQEDMALLQTLLKCLVVMSKDLWWDKSASLTVTKGFLSDWCSQTPPKLSPIFAVSSLPKWKLLKWVDCPVFPKNIETAKCQWVSFESPLYPKLNWSHTVCWYQALLWTEMTPTAGLKTCIWTWCRASMLTTANTQTDEGGGMSGHDRKEIWSLSQLCSLSHPSHSSLHPLPIARLSTPLVMTML